MYTTLSDFHADLDKVERLLSLTRQIKELSGFQDFNFSNSESIIVQERIDSTLEKAITDLQSISRDNHSNLVILNGTLLLFIVGRFESFIKETFEEYCRNIADRVRNFTELPKDMRDNLIRYTSEVISNPRKYGHAENGVRAFVKVMYDNMHNENAPIEINYKCLSITSENMRPDILSDLFKRAEVKNIWERLSQQSKLQFFWESSDASGVRKKSESHLNGLMDKRNSIAHPSTSIIWPDAESIIYDLNFFKTFSSVLIEVLPVYEIEVGVNRNA
ncbi:HEPN domain-containing protein [Kosakonia cowanii]|uniref:HEPN domain-containing protein n=1 Tax=Kosakonia cowanii TaxID=208223 RepID=UPI0039A607CE